MAVSRSGSSNVPSLDSLEYTDFKQLRFNSGIVNSGYGGPASNSNATVNTVDMSEHLGNDEVFELVTLDWEFGAWFAMDGSRASETEPGNAEVSGVWEINSGQGEWLLTDTRTAPWDDNDGFQTLDWYENVIFPSVQDSVNGMGSGLGPSSDTYRNVKNFRELYGTGPFLDVNDELDLRREYSTEHVSMAVEHRVTAVFNGLVYTIEGARPDLASPF